MGSPCRKRSRSAFIALPPAVLERVAAATAAALTLTFSSCPLSAPLPAVAGGAPAPAALPDAEHTLAAEAWALVRAHDAAAVGAIADGEGATLADSPMRSRSDTYTAVRRAANRAGDSQARVLAPRDMEALRRFGAPGVGLELEARDGGKLFVASEPKPGTAAAEVGLKVGDELLTIDGLTTKKVSVEEAYAKLQRADLAPVNLRLRSAGDVVLAPRFTGKRAVGGYKPVRRSVVADDDHMVGYVRVFELRPGAGDDVRRALDTLAADGADAWVLDLRGNGGGSFDAMLDVASAFMGPGVPATLLGVPGRTPVPYATPDLAELVGIGPAPLAVVVDRDTAGEAEVLACALRAQCRAVVYGDATRGRAGIQAVFPLSDGAGLVLTVAEYRSPDGSPIQPAGLQPDVSLASNGDRPKVDWQLVQHVTSKCSAPDS